MKKPWPSFLYPFFLGFFLAAWPVNASWGKAAAPADNPFAEAQTILSAREAQELKPALRKYTIREKDTLWDLAGAFYGNPWVWPLFLKFNSISDPDLIFPGQALLFPGNDVLMNIRKKSPAEVREIREEMVRNHPPVVVSAPPTAEPAAPSAPPSAAEPATPVATPAQTPITEVIPPSTPVPTPLRTPTFKITGSKTLNLSYSEAVGSGGSGFTNTGYDRHETLRLQMEGQLNDEVKITGHFAQSDLALDDEYDLALSTRHWEAFFGNFAAALPGSQFLSSGQSTTGLRLTGKYDTWNLVAFYGTPRGRTVYEKFFGNNTQGPYSIPNTPLVPGSENLWMNKQKLIRGVDYNLDYTLGTLSFLNRIVQLTDLIEVTAQSRSSLFDTQLYGYRTELALVGKTGTAETGITPKSGVPVTQATAVPVTQTALGLGAATTAMAGTAALDGTMETPQSEEAAQGSKSFQGVKWTIGQGYMRQFEQPDANITTASGRVAADTHILELDTTLDLGPALKLGGEADGSAYLSSDPGRVPSRQGVAYRAQADTFQGLFHGQGKLSGNSPNFTAIGNPLAAGNFLEWTLLGDFKQGTELFAQADRTFQRTFASGAKDETTTDHGEARAKPKGLPEADYVYYHSDEQREDAVLPFRQEVLRNTLGFLFGLPGELSVKTSGLQESRTGTNLGRSDSYGGRMEVASRKWKNFNFALSGEWKLNNIVEASSNTQVPQAATGNNIPSQTYTYTMEGKPLEHLSLTGKGLYSDEPPGPVKANLTETFQTDPFKWLNAGGSYSLDFQQTQAQGSTTPDRVHTGSGSLELTPLSWLKLSAQPTFRLDLLPLYGNQLLSENFHQNYRAGLNPSFGSLSGDFTLDQYKTWDGSTAGFPQNFRQQTQTLNLAVRKQLGKVSEEVSYKRTNQTQDSLSGGSTTTSHSLNQTETDSFTWNASMVITLALGHAYNQMDQDSPGAGDLENPLLPYGSDSFNTTYSTSPLNAHHYSHTFTGRVTEQLDKALTLWQEGGYTRTVDEMHGGKVDTYSPAAGFTWRPGSFLNWTGSYQYNGSSGQVSTAIQKAQSTVSASLNPGTTLSASWTWSRADNPFVLSQQANTSFTMNF